MSGRAELGNGENESSSSHRDDSDLLWTIKNIHIFHSYKHEPDPGTRLRRASAHSSRSCAHHVPRKTTRRPRPAACGRCCCCCACDGCWARGRSLSAPWCPPSGRGMPLGLLRLVSFPSRDCALTPWSTCCSPASQNTVLLKFPDCCPATSSINGNSPFPRICAGVTRGKESRPQSQKSGEGTKLPNHSAQEGGSKTTKQNPQS